MVAASAHLNGRSRSPIRPSAVKLNQKTFFCIAAPIVVHRAGERTCPASILNTKAQNRASSVSGATPGLGYIVRFAR